MNHWSGAPEQAKRSPLRKRLGTASQAAISRYRDAAVRVCVWDRPDYSSSAAASGAVRGSVSHTCACNWPSTL